MMEIKSLAARRRQLTEILKAEKNRRTRTQSSFAAKDTEDLIVDLKKRISKLQKEIERLIEMEQRGCEGHHSFVVEKQISDGEQQHRPESWWCLFGPTPFVVTGGVDI